MQVKSDILATFANLNKRNFLNWKLTSINYSKYSATYVKCAKTCPRKILYNITYFMHEIIFRLFSNPINLTMYETHLFFYQIKNKITWIIKEAKFYSKILMQWNFYGFRQECFIQMPAAADLHPLSIYLETFKKKTFLNIVYE